jgi:hypothetical protein
MEFLKLFEEFDLSFMINERIEDYCIYLYSIKQVDFSIPLDKKGKMDSEIYFTEHDDLPSHIATKSNFQLFQMTQDRRDLFLSELAEYIKDQAQYLLSRINTDITKCLRNELMENHDIKVASSYDIKLVGDLISLTHRESKKSLGIYEEAIHALDCIKINEFLNINYPEYETKYNQNHLTLFCDSEKVGEYEYDSSLFYENVRLGAFHYKSKNFTKLDKKLILSELPESRAYIYQKIFGINAELTLEFVNIFIMEIGSLMERIYDFIEDNEIDINNDNEKDMILLRFQESIDIRV